MAISHRSTGAATFTNTMAGVAIPIGAGASAGDMMICIGACKAFSVTTSINNGWTKIGTEFHDSSNTAAGVDVGSMSVSAFYKEHTGSESNPTVAHSASPSCSGFLIMVFQKGGGETWNTPVFVGGGDNSAGTGYSTTCNADPGVTTGDAIAHWSAWGTDAATPCSTHITASQTGITFTETEDPATDPETTTGGDMGMCVKRATVSGTSSAAPVLAGTIAASIVGSSGFVRLRVTAAAGATYPGYDGGGWFFREQEWMRDPRIPRLGNIVDLAPIRERIDRERLIAA